MITNLIVIGSIVFGAAFVLAWLVRPDVRAWVEKPKHRFQANVRRYDRREPVLPSTNEDYPSD